MRRTPRCWVLHPEGRPFDPAWTCMVADYPDAKDAEEFMRGEVERTDKAAKLPIKIPGLDRLGSTLARKL